MSVELEWHFGDEAPKQAPQEERRPRRRRWRFWLTLAAVVLALVVVGLYAWWRVRREALKMVESEVQAVAQLELQALAQRDVALYLSLQDEADPNWQQAQRARVASDAAFPPPLPSLTSMIPFSVENARAVGDGARVEVVRFASLPGDQALPFRATRFYRRDDDGRWLHTRADLSYAGHTVIFTGQRVVVTSFAIDADLMKPVAFKLEGAAEQFCALISCQSSAPVPLVFTDTLDAALEPGGALPAPFVVGVPAGELAHAAWEQALDDLLLDRLAAREAGYLVDETPRTAQGGELFRARGRAWLRAKLGLQPAPSPPDLDLVSRALDAQEWLRLDVIWRFPLAQDDPRRPLAEAEVDLFLAFIEQEQGPSRVADMLVALYTAPWEGAAISGALGENWFTFERRYLAFVRQVTGRPPSDEPYGQAGAFAEADLVVACRDLTNLWGVRLDEPAMMPLLWGAGFETLLWSPDGARLLAWQPAIHRGRLYFSETDGSAWLPLTSVEAAAMGDVFWINGARLLASQPAIQGGGLYLLQADGSAVRRLASVPAEAMPLGWSPDGRYAAYSVAGPSSQGGVVDVETDASVALSGGYLSAVSWCGPYLVYVATQGSSPPALWLAEADGSGSRQVGEGLAVACSPDGGQIAFSGTDDWPGLNILDVTTGVTRTLLDRSALVALLDPGAERADLGVSVLAWSSAGDWISFGAVQHIDTGLVQGSVGLIRPDGSDPRILLTQQEVAYVGGWWSPDGRRLLTVASTGDQVTLTVTGIDGELLFESSSWAGGSLSPDGRYVAIVEGSRMRTLRVVEIETGASYVFELPAPCVSLAWNPRGPLHEAAQDYGFEAPCG